MDNVIGKVDMKEENVIMFPRNKKNTPPQTLEEIKERAFESRIMHSQEACEKAMDAAIAELFRNGMDVDDTNIEELHPSILLALESLNSLYLHYCEIEHPLQEFAKENFKDDEENDTD